MSVDLKTLCPHCQTPIGVRAAYVGRTVRCPKCEESFEVASVRPAGATPPDSSATLDEAAAAVTTAPAPPPVPEPASPKLGRFELKSVLGQGAFGRVYRAYDPQLDRFVALKVPTFSSDDSRRVLRFIAEAKSAARLRHPNIVPTYESGRIGGQYYIAAQFVAGRPLSKRIQDDPPDIRQAVDWVRQLAQALAYAHGEAIVHRDIKPDNIMLDEKQVPQLMDFGLARRIDEDSTMTTDGSIMGTPAYMSPEQARGDNARIGPLSDQFSLGVVLYELLSGKRPFEGSSHAVLNLVATADPTPLRALRPEIPRDLEAICQKAMEKEQSRRYPDAQAFEADLTRWLDGAPVSARTSRPWERAVKWSKRNPTVAVLTAGILMTFVLAFAGITAALGEAITSRRNAISERNAAQAARDSARRSAEDLKRQKGELKTSLENLQAATTRADSKTAEAGRLDVQLQKVRANIEVAESRVKAAEEAERSASAKVAEAKAEAEAALTKVAQETERAQSTLGKSYYDLGNRRCQDGLVAEGALWLVRGLETLPPSEKTAATSIRQALNMYLGSTAVQSMTPELRLAFEHDAEVTAADFHPYEPLIITGDNTGRLHLWNTETGARLLTTPAHEKPVRVIAFAPTEAGDSFLSAGEDSFTLVWRVTKDRKLEPLNPKMRQTFPVTSAAWSANGKAILTAGDQSRHMQLWNAGTRRVSGSPFGEDNGGRIYALSMVRDSDPNASALVAFVGTGHLQRSVALWDAIQGKPIAGKMPLVLPGDVTATAVDPTGKAGVAATTDKKLVFIDLEAWKVDGRTVEMSGRPTAVAWSPVQPLVLVGRDDRSAILVDKVERKPLGDPLPHGGPVTAVNFHPAGDEFLTASSDRTVRLWKLPRGRERQEMAAGGEVTALALSPDGRRVAAAIGRDLTLWSADSGKLLTTIRDRITVMSALAFAPNNQTFVVGDDRVARMWNARTLKPIGVEMPHSDRVTAVAYSRDGKYIVSASIDRTARVWDAQTWNPVSDPLPHPERVTSAVFTEDGLGVITGCSDANVRVWSWSDARKPLTSITAASSVSSVALSEDGKMIAIGCANGEATAWNAQSGEQLAAPTSLAGYIAHVSFLPHSLTLVTGSAAGIDTWDIAARQRVGNGVKLGGQATTVSASRDGLTWASAVEGKEGKIVVWGVPPPLRTSPKWLSEWVKVRTGRQLSENGVVSALSAKQLQAVQKRLAELEKEPDSDR